MVVLAIFTGINCDNATVMTRLPELYTQLYPEAVGNKASVNIRCGDTTDKLSVVSDDGTSGAGQAPARLSWGDTFHLPDPA